MLSFFEVVRTAMTVHDAKKTKEKANFNPTSSQMDCLHLLSAEGPKESGGPPEPMKT